MRRVCLTAWLIAAIGAAPATAQDRPTAAEQLVSTTIAGQVIAADTGTPLRGVQVRLRGASGDIRLAVTDERGRFEAPNLFAASGACRGASSSITLADITIDRFRIASCRDEAPSMVAVKPDGSDTPSRLNVPKPVSVPAGSALAELVLSQHERWDGMGYPRRLAGDLDSGPEAWRLRARRPEVDPRGAVRCAPCLQDHGDADRATGSSDAAARLMPHSEAILVVARPGRASAAGRCRAGGQRARERAA